MHYENAQKFEGLKVWITLISFILFLKEIPDLRVLYVSICFVV